jgi:ATP-dependent RNA helicase RhlE
MTFQDLNLIKNIHQVLVEENYTVPTPIQQQAIPIVLAGDDLVGIAQTGTGKTAAFSLPIINYLHPIIGGAMRRKTLRALVLAPTRELAIQIQQNIENYAKYTHIKTAVIFGGVNQANQVDQLKSGIDILIATPGRLLDLHKQGFVDLNNLHFLVLDEADLMLDMGFIHDVKKVMKLSPENKQTLLFTATMSVEIREIAQFFLKDPKYITIAPVVKTENNIAQSIYFLEKADKKKLLYHLIRNEKIKNAIVFVRTKHGADNVVKHLKKNDVKAEAIHGDKTQTTRQRVLEAFKNQEIDILVATDIAARGIDIEQMPYVVNYDLPNISDTFIHRIGRTARNGETGTAISFCSPDELTYWKDILKLLKNTVKEVSDHPYPLTSSTADQQALPAKNEKNDAAKSPKTNNFSRKSDQSKKNKKRWY